MARQFTLFTRKRKNLPPLFYAYIKQADGSRGKPVNTGHTLKEAAVKWCEEEISRRETDRIRAELETERAALAAERKALVIQKESEFNPTFREFSEGFYSWEGHWSTNKRSTGKRISERQCREKTAILNKTVLPVLGDVHLKDITRDHIDGFRNDLFRRGYAGNTINAALSVIRPILERAEDLKIITSMPRVERAALNCKRKDIFTMEELHALFAVQWGDFRAYVANMAAASSGCRRGELLALQIQDVQGDFLHISKSWDESSRSMSYGTKSGRARYVIIPKKVQHEIARLIEINPFGRPDSFVFFSTLPDKPIESKIVTRELYRAMRKIGIPEGERVRRNLTFHSWRHLFNSILVNARIPAEKIRTITGHLTPEMTAHYFKLSVDGYGDIRKVQDGLFG